MLNYKIEHSFENIDYLIIPNVISLVINKIQKIILINLTVSSSDWML